ncbi:MAG: Threonine dehydrogenase and related Zn-dependent dehydrogenases, partial [uncultured Friedmanniella sp.]
SRSGCRRSCPCWATTTRWASTTSPPTGSRSRRPRTPMRSSRRSRTVRSRSSSSP